MKEKEEEEEEWSDDDDEEVDEKGKKGKVLGKRKRKDKMDGVEDFFKNEEIEEVPADDPGTRKAKG